MKPPEDIKKGLECCVARWAATHFASCKSDCPYWGEGVWCKNVMHSDVSTYIRQLESSRWELFEGLSTAYYGKQMYGLNDDGTVYSRYSCDTMSFDQAVDEFRRLISDE